jgi:hypothetical protein
VSKGYSKPPLFPFTPEATLDPFSAQRGPSWRGDIGFVNASELTSSGVWNQKRELKALLEDPHRITDQLIHFLEP